MVNETAFELLLSMVYFAATSPNGDDSFWLTEIYIRNVRQGPRRCSEESLNDIALKCLHFF